MFSFISAMTGFNCVAFCNIFLKHSEQHDSFLVDEITWIIDMEELRPGLLFDFCDECVTFVAIEVENVFQDVVDGFWTVSRVEG